MDSIVPFPVQYDERIDKTMAHRFKVEITCTLHPTKRWRTKNISPIGSRTVFYSGDLSHTHGFGMCLLRNELYSPTILIVSKEGIEDCYSIGCTGTLVLARELA